MKVLYHDHEPTDKGGLMITRQTEWTDLNIQREYIECRERGISFSVHFEHDGQKYAVYGMPIGSVLPKFHDELNELLRHHHADEQKRTTHTVVWLIHKDGGYSLVAPLYYGNTIPAQGIEMISRAFYSKPVTDEDIEREQERAEEALEKLGQIAPGQP